MAEKLKNEFLTEFIAFLQKYGVVGLAIGVVMGTAVNELVKNFVDNIISPLISLVLKFALQGIQLENVEIYGFRVGSFANALIKFVLIAFVVYITVKFFMSHFMTEEEQEKLHIKRLKKEKEEAEAKMEEAQDKAEEAEKEAADAKAGKISQEEATSKKKKK
ncbi:MAG: hypothetical protein OHK0017_04960 [Patescibacteria group bacterium]